MTFFVEVWPRLKKRLIPTITFEGFKTVNTLVSNRKWYGTIRMYWLTRMLMVQLHIPIENRVTS